MDVLLHDEFLNLGPFTHHLPLDIAHQLLIHLFIVCLQVLNQAVVRMPSLFHPFLVRHLLSLLVFHADHVALHLNLSLLY